MKRYTIKCDLLQEVVAENEEEAYQQFWQDVHQALGEEELADVVKTEGAGE